MCLCFRVSWTVTRLCWAALIGWMGWLRDLRSHDGLSVVAEQSVRCFCSHKIKNKMKKYLRYLLPCAGKTLEPQKNLFLIVFFSPPLFSLWRRVQTNVWAALWLRGWKRPSSFILSSERLTGHCWSRGRSDHHSNLASWVCTRQPCAWFMHTCAAKNCCCCVSRGRINCWCPQNWNKHFLFVFPENQKGCE